MAMDNFDGSNLMECLVPNLVDGCHAACPKLAKDLVLAPKDSPWNYL